jgi:hypothetical protein
MQLAVVVDALEAVLRAAHADRGALLAALTGILVAGVAGELGGDAAVVGGGWAVDVVAVAAVAAAALVLLGCGVEGGALAGGQEQAGERGAGATVHAARLAWIVGGRDRSAIGPARGRGSGLVGGPARGR